VVERELLATPSISDVVSFGGTIKRYELLVDPVLLSAHQLTFEDVTKAFAQANGNAGGGAILFGRAALNVRGIGLLSPDQIGEVILLITVVLFFFIGNVRAALIAAVTIPLSLLFAFICMDLAHIPANLLSIGALDFGMIVDGAIIMVENVVRHIAEKQKSGHPY